MMREERVWHKTKHAMLAMPQSIKFGIYKEEKYISEV